jgi:hypothetical protein
MALPSLAFGIGLSGKPIDRAALNLRREEGAQRAKAKEADDKRKKLEPYQKPEPHSGKTLDCCLTLQMPRVAKSLEKP